MGKKSAIIGLFVAVVLFTSNQASACLCLDPSFPDTVTIEHDGYGAVGMAELWGGGLTGANRHAGVYMLDKTAHTGEGELWDNGYIAAFCIELSQSSPGDPKKYGVVQPEDAHMPTTFLGEHVGQAKADYLSELWGRHFDSAWAEGESFTSEQNAAAEAFAAAVWEIVYENLPASPALYDVTMDGTSGSLGFRAGNLDTVLANSMLHSLDGTGPKAELRAFVNGCNQDFLVQVPEPATILLLGLSSLTLLRGRKNRQ